MKLRFILCALVLFSCSSDDNSSVVINETPMFLGEVDSVRTFGGSNNEEANSVVATQDGGYAILSTTRSIDGDVAGATGETIDFWLLKFSQDDVLQWSKTYGGSGIEQAQKLIENPDGSFILVGYTSSDDGDVSANAGLKDLWILKVDSLGNTIWSKTYGFVGEDEAFSIIATNDGGYFVCGYLDVTASEGQGNDGRSQQGRHGVGDFWGLKLNASGNYEWRRYFGGTNNDKAYDVVQTSDNGFLMIGSTESVDVDVSSNKGSYDYWLVKIDASGSMQWERTLGGSQMDNGYGLAEASDGNYLVLGDTRSNDIDVTTSKGFEDIWVVKISPDNEVIWKKSYGGTGFDSARSISTTASGDFLISGFSNSSDLDISSNFGQNDAWVLKIDTDGTILFEKSIGGTKEDQANGVVELLDGSVVLVGETNSDDNDISGNKGFTDIFVVKIK